MKTSGRSISGTWIMLLLLLVGASFGVTSCLATDDEEGLEDDDDDNDDDNDDNDDNDDSSDDDDDNDDDSTDDDDDSIGCDENDPDESRALGCVMLRYINQDRAMFPDESNNAGPLVWDEDLYPVVLGHSQDMCDRMFFDHNNPDGKSPFDRMDDGGVDYSSAGENIAYNPDHLDAQYRFMAECRCVQNHRSNCLNPTFTRAAVAVYRCDHTPEGIDGDYLYITQNFRSLMGEPFLTVPYCEDTSMQNSYWVEPASSAPWLEYWGEEEHGSGYYTTCEGEKRRKSFDSDELEYGVK